MGETSPEEMTIETVVALHFERNVIFTPARKGSYSLPMIGTDRGWMVGRVATTFSAPLIDFATNKKIKIPKRPLNHAAAKSGCLRSLLTPTPSFLTPPISVLA